MQPRQDPAEPLHLALASDGNPSYLAGLTVAAASALRYLSPRAALTVHILDCGIPDADFARIEAILRKERADAAVRRHPIDPERFAGFRLWKGSLAAYARLLLPELLPEARWVCYADCDILFTGDLADLFALADDAKAILGHRDCAPCYPDLWEPLAAWYGLNPDVPLAPARYLCTGLLLMNLEAFRRDNLAARCLDFLRRHPDNPYPDQAALNAVCLDALGLLGDPWGTPIAQPHDWRRGHVGGALHFSGYPPWRPCDEKNLWAGDLWRRLLFRRWLALADALLPRDSPWRAALPALRGFWWRKRLSSTLWLRLPRWVAAPPWVRGRNARAKRLWVRRGEPGLETAWRIRPWP